MNPKTTLFCFSLLIFAVSTACTGPKMVSRIDKILDRHVSKKDSTALSDDVTIYEDNGSDHGTIQDLPKKYGKHQITEGDHLLTFSGGPFTLEREHIGFTAVNVLNNGEAFDKYRTGLGVPIHIGYSYAFADQFTVGLLLYKDKVNFDWVMPDGEIYQTNTFQYTVFGGRVTYHFERLNWLDLYASVEVGKWYGSEQVEIKGQWAENAIALGNPTVSNADFRSKSYLGGVLGAQYFPLEFLGIHVEAGYSYIPIQLGITVRFNKPYKFSKK